MDGKDFDRLTRAAVMSASRRQVIKVLGGGIAGALAGLLGPRSAEAQYSRRCTRFVLSGGKAVNDKILVDDYLVVKLNGNRLPVRKNGATQDDKAGPRDPIRFYARPNQDTLTVAAVDKYASCWGLGALYLHCIEEGDERGRGSRRLWETLLPTDGCKNPERWQARTFFERSVTI